jgi:hypothetical protein
MDELARLNEVVAQAEAIYDNLSGDKNADVLLCDAAAYDVLAAKLRRRSFLRAQRSSAGIIEKTEGEQHGKVPSAA